MSEDEIIAMMLENDKMKTALCEIANFSASWRSGYVDEWEEAAAFCACRRIASEAIDCDEDGDA